jgi:hypothetical protein
MKKVGEKKQYVKPEWVKQEMFERFVTACVKHPTHCSPANS